jgi:hypothetical protein
MKKKVNILYKPLTNEYGTVFGHSRIEFPTTKANLTKLAKNMPASNLKDDPSSRFAFEKNAPDDWGRDTDVWSQERIDSAGSIEEAIKIYFS